MLNWLQTSRRVELVHVGMRQISQARVPANHRTCIAVVVKDKCNKEHYVGTIYRTPNDDIYGSQAAGILRDLLSEMHSENIVLMGDFNYGNIDWNTLQPGLSSSANTTLFLDYILTIIGQPRNSVLIRIV